MAGFPQRSETREIVLSPQESLLAGGPAEQLEQQIQTSFKQGVHRIFVDLRAVPTIAATISFASCSSGEPLVTGADS